MYDHNHAELLLKGLAAGDRNGGPIRLAILLFEEVRQFGFSKSCVFDSYFDWVTTDGFDMGPTLASVCRYSQQGLSISEAVERTHLDFDEKTAGIAPAHRAAPLALFFQGSKLDEVAFKEASLSHYSPTAGQVSVATVRLCSALLRGVDLHRACSLACEGLKDIDLSYLPKNERYKGGFAPKVLQTALSFLREHHNFEDALSASLSFAGPANYCPVLVGSMGACLFKEVPSSLLEHALYPQKLDSLF
ncbi:MAG: hypothetical protein CMK59_02280 [Proteobacteria bacterium]|nr:hypothetical protein [Pseudomonadota bacterium]